MTLWLLVQMPYHSSLGDSRAKAIKLSSGADLAGESVGGVHLPPPPHPPEMTYSFLIQLVFCIKLCLRHQSVTPLLSDAPLP